MFNEKEEDLEKIEEIMEDNQEEVMDYQLHEEELIDLDAYKQLEEGHKNLQEEVSQLKDQLLRNAAELENFKRRMNEERVRERMYRAQSVVESIIPAIDNFERALGVEAGDEAVANFLTGFKMIHGQLVEALGREGVEVIPTSDTPFDPNVHQAVMQESVEGVEAGMVLAELQKGYRLKDRVIRPAMVKVSQ